MNNLISYVYAADANVIPNSSSYSFILMLLVFLLIFYYMIFRPQRKKFKDHDKLIKSLSCGDEVLTTSGFIGKVTKITKTGYIVLELNTNIIVFIKSDFITSVFPKGTLKNIQ